MNDVKIIECPRDAMQGIHDFIPTQQKLDYLQFLLSVGFDTLDFGSFVSPKAVPQMRDTAEIIQKLDISQTKTKLLAIIGNIRGAEEAAKYKAISYFGYPFSISEIFQTRNVNRTLDESIADLTEIIKIAKNAGKEVVGYISMGFGNPYGDPWNEAIVIKWTRKLIAMGIKIISLSDTVGTAEPEVIFKLFDKLIPMFPEIEFGAHLHTPYNKWFDKVDAAYRAGCRRFDGAIKGFGGCPMAKDHVTGNMPTEKLVTYFTAKKQETHLNMMRFESAYNEALKVFG